MNINSRYLAVRFASLLLVVAVLLAGCAKQPDPNAPPDESYEWTSLRTDGTTYDAIRVTWADGEAPRSKNPSFGELTEITFKVRDDGYLTTRTNFKAFRNGSRGLVVPEGRSTPTASALRYYLLDRDAFEAFLTAGPPGSR